MDLELQLRASLAPINPRPELHSSILARVSTNGAAARDNGRGRNRTILVCTILAVAAAAAMLGLNLVNGPEPQVADAAPAIEPAAVSTLDEPPASEQALSETHPATAVESEVADPAVRAQVWRSLQGSRDPARLEPAIAALWKESDADIRQQLVMLLTEGFSSEQRARDALEQVARAESRPLARALAQRALTGESLWRLYVMSSLQDETRSDSERMEAFMYYFFPPGQSPGSTSASGLLGRSQDLFDDKSIGALAQLLPGVAGSSDSRGKAMMVVSELSSMRKSEVNVMLLDLIDKQIDAGIKSLVRVSTRVVRVADYCAAARCASMIALADSANWREGIRKATKR